MRKLMALIVSLLTMAGLASCKTAKTETVADEGGKTIVIYYSQSGATKTVAEELASQLNCDIAAIEAVNPYDGDYPSTIARWMEEKKDSVKVELKPLAVNLDEYDSIFLGFPIWGGTYALPIASFLEDNNLDGKEVVTFATFGSGGIEKATVDVAVALPGADVKQGYGVRNARISKAPAEISRFLAEEDYVSSETEVETLPAFSDHAAVSDAEATIFHAACDNYQFPLGTPVSVASRVTPEGMEYEFGVKSTTPDGEETNALIYVIAPENETPEFTKVVR